jgi:hypothetical protein
MGVLAIIFNLIDVVATTYLITTGSGYELNPLMAWLQGFGIEWFIFYKTVVVTGLVLFLMALHKHKNASFSLQLVTFTYALLVLYYIVGFTIYGF